MFSAEFWRIAQCAFVGSVDLAMSSMLGYLINRAFAEFVPKKNNMETEAFLALAQLSLSLVTGLELRRLTFPESFISMEPTCGIAFIWGLFQGQPLLWARVNEFWLTFTQWLASSTHEKAQGDN